MFNVIEYTADFRNGASAVKATTKVVKGPIAASTAHRMAEKLNDKESSMKGDPDVLKSYVVKPATS